MGGIHWASLFYFNNGQDCLENTLFSDQQGEIVSHENYGLANYANALTCMYQINAEVDDEVIIVLTALDIENDQTCNWDNLVIRYVQSATVETICGSTLSDPRFRSTIRDFGSVQIEFETDGSSNAAGFSLTYEVVQPNPCDSNQCQNGSTCQQQDQTFECICADGWTGNLCQIDVNECTDDNICTNNGICSNQDGGFECLCDFGYSGSGCELSTCLVESPCSNGGTCSMLPLGQYQCDCSGPFSGVNCTSSTTPTISTMTIMNGFLAFIVALVTSLTVLFLVHRYHRRPKKHIPETPSFTPKRYAKNQVNHIKVRESADTDLWRERNSRIKLEKFPIKTVHRQYYEDTYTVEDTVQPTVQSDKRRSTNEKPYQAKQSRVCINLDTPDRSSNPFTQYSTMKSAARNMPNLSPSRTPYDHQLHIPLIDGINLKETSGHPNSRYSHAMFQNQGFAREAAFSKM